MATTTLQSDLYTELAVYRSKMEGKRTISRKAADMLTQQLKDLRAAFEAGKRWSSVFAKRTTLVANGNQTYLTSRGH